MPTSDTTYEVDFPLPELIQQGRDNLIQCPLYVAGVLFAGIFAGTVSVFDATGTAVVDEAAIVVTSSISSYTIPEAVLADSTLGEGWRVVWTLTLTDGERVFDNEASLVRRALFPTATHTELYRRASALDPSGSAPISSRTDYDDELQAAWVEIEQRLIADGRRPWLIVSPSALRLPLLHLWMALIFEDMSHRLSLEYAEHAAMYRERYETAWSRVRFLYDTDGDGETDATDRAGATSTLWAC